MSDFIKYFLKTFWGTITLIAMATMAYASPESNTIEKENIVSDTVVEKEQGASLYDLAKEKIFQGRNDEAIKILEQATISEDSPQSVEARRMLFLLKGKAGNLNVNYSDATPEERPELMLALANGYLEYAQQQQDRNFMLRAQELYLKVANEFISVKAQVKALSQLSFLAKFQNNDEQALYYLTKLIANFGSYSQLQEPLSLAYFNLGEILLLPGKNRDTLRAKKALQKAYELGSQETKKNAQTLLQGL